MIQELLPPYKEPPVVDRGQMIDFVKNNLPVEQTHGKPIFIHIAGSSGSGKSECSKMIASAIPECKIFTMDSYLKGKKYVTELKQQHSDKESFFGEDDIRVFDIETIAEDINRMAKGLTIIKPDFDMHKGERVGFQPFAPSKIVIIEGIHAINPQLMLFVDLSLFIEASLHDRFIRRIVRDHRDYNSDPLSQIIYNYLTQTEPSFQQHAARFRNSADAVIQNSSQPAIDFSQINSLENQTSFILEEISFILKATPKIFYGSEHPEESLRIAKLKDGKRLLQYFVLKRLLINDGISNEVFSALSQIYDFEKVE